MNRDWGAVRVEARSPSHVRRPRFGGRRAIATRPSQHTWQAERGSVVVKLFLRFLETSDKLRRIGVRGAKRRI
jgi:hypothetical protein